MTATLYRADGTKEEVLPANGRSFSLEELQKFVGGYIEYQWLPDGKRRIVMNEDGIELKLPPNAAATVMAYHLYTPEHGILGDVLVCEPKLLGD